MAFASLTRIQRAGALTHSSHVALFYMHLLISLQADYEHVSGLSRRLIDGINGQVDHVVRNGDLNGYPGCVNLSFAYVEVGTLVYNNQTIC